ncbi:MAG: succinate dehydrogenase assembly factor 2 [Gammaproteobacteria bacterium]|nr:succinate dehydrogenase assembly factor 2 [Gammaproteobacteria bacterium]
MLELDLLFRPFAEACFEQLSSEFQLAFVELLDRDDFELLDLTRQPDQIPRFTKLIQMVMRFRTTGEIEDSKPLC